MSLYWPWAVSKAISYAVARLLARVLRSLDNEAACSLYRPTRAACTPGRRSDAVRVEYYGDRLQAVLPLSVRMPPCNQNRSRECLAPATKLFRVHNWRTDVETLAR